MVFLICTKEKIEKNCRGDFMLNEKITNLREKLNKSIEEDEDYSVIYNISIQLDELIAAHYREKNKKCVSHR